MATLDEFNTNNGNQTEDNNENGTIINPNLKKRKFKPIPDANNMRQIDPVKDLGLKSAEEEYLENREPNDLEKAFSKLDEINEQRSREYDKYLDLYEQTDGEFTKEEFIEEVKDGIDYEAMLSSPPDPLNKDLVDFSKKQREKAMREAEELGEELESPVYHSDSFDGGPINPLPEISDDELEEDDEIMEEMDSELGGVNEMDDKNSINDDPMATLRGAIDKVKEEPQPSENVDTETASSDDIPTIDVGGPPKMDDKPKIEDIKKAMDDQTNIHIPDEIPGLYDLDIDKELAELESDGAIEESDDADKKYQERLKIVQGDLKKKVLPIANNFNITGFAISNKPVSISNSLTMANNSHNQKQAMWVLPSTGIPIVMNEFSGPEIDSLAKTVTSRNRTAFDVRQQYKPLFNHVASPKPETLDEWLQIISVMDIKHLYGTVYKACFEGINFLPYDCPEPKCNNGFISDDIPFEKMVKYKDLDAKKKVESIYRSVPGKEKYTLYTSEILPISNIYAMSFRDPSIYDAIMAPAYLDADWRSKMEDVVAIATYVDKIFVIDPTNKCLRPLNIKEWKDDVKKNLKAKVLALAKVIETLTSDQYNLLSAYIENINKDHDFMDYHRPEIHCPKCKTKIEASEESSIELLFMRHRLTSLVAG